MENKDASGLPLDEIIRRWKMFKKPTAEVAAMRDAFFDGLDNPAHKLITVFYAAGGQVTLEKTVNNGNTVFYASCGGSPIVAIGGRMSAAAILSVEIFIVDERRFENEREEQAFCAQQQKAFVRTVIEAILSQGYGIENTAITPDFVEAWESLSNDGLAKPIARRKSA